MPPCRISNNRHKITAMLTGDYDPGCLFGRVLFLLLFFPLPLLALAKASHPTINSIISGKTTLRDTICTWGADNSFGGNWTAEISLRPRVIPEKCMDSVVR